MSDEPVTLIYGLHLFRGVAPQQGGPHHHVPVAGPDGRQGDMALHTLTGSREQIRARLLESIDAYFDLVQPPTDD
jgi:hypothetical protein